VEEADIHSSAAAEHILVGEAARIPLEADPAVDTVPEAGLAEDDDTRPPSEEDTGPAALAADIHLDCTAARAVEGHTLQAGLEEAQAAEDTVRTAAVQAVVVVVVVEGVLHMAVGGDIPAEADPGEAPRTGPAAAPEAGIPAECPDNTTSPTKRSLRRQERLGQLGRGKSKDVNWHVLAFSA